MTERERFLKIARFELRGDVFVPRRFQSFWVSTLESWTREGLPHSLYRDYMKRKRLVKSGTYLEHGLPDDEPVHQHFGFDRFEVVPVNADDTNPLVPRFEKRIVEEGPDWQILIDYDGVTRKEFIPKSDAEEVQPSSMSQWLAFPVKNRSSWNELKKKLDPTSPARYPANWDELRSAWRRRDYPLGMNVGSFYGWIRDWIGMENLSCMFYDDPHLIHDIMDHLEYFMIELIKKVVDEVDLDFAHFWEDMAYKTGPLISPRLFKEFMSPRYRRVVDTLRSHGIDIITVDSDGNINELIPLWLEVGVNGFWPLEVAAGMDAVSLRKKYGRDCILIGNIDKRILARGKKEIEAEVSSKVPFLLSKGGYFPTVDHSVPPDVSYENFLYYLEVLRKTAT